MFSLLQNFNQNAEQRLFMHKKVVYDTKQPYTSEDPWAKDINVWKVSSTKFLVFLTIRLLEQSIIAIMVYLGLMLNTFEKPGFKNNFKPTKTIWNPWKNLAMRRLLMAKAFL